MTVENQPRKTAVVTSFSKVAIGRLPFQEASSSSRNAAAVNYFTGFRQLPSSRALEPEEARTVEPLDPCEVAGQLKMHRSFSFDFRGNWARSGDRRIFACG